MEKYRHVGEGELSRRHFIKEVAHLGVAAGAAGFFGREILVSHRTQEKELEELRKSPPKHDKELIDNARRIVDRYRACQERTNDRCHLLMPTEELIEVDKALRIVNEQKTHKEEVEKRIRHGNKMKRNSLIVVAYALFEASLAGKRLVNKVGRRVKGKIM